MSSSLLRTCQYSDAAPVPSSWARRRIDSASRPSRSRTLNAASTITSRLSRVRREASSADDRQGGSGKRWTAAIGLRQRTVRRTVFDERRVRVKERRDLHTSAIEAEGLVKTYPGDVQALDGISFAVPSGTVFGLLGPNGAGKSTTVKVLTTLSRPDAGRASVAGHDVLREPAACAARSAS